MADWIIVRRHTSFYNLRHQLRYEGAVTTNCFRVYRFRRYAERLLQWRCPDSRHLHCRFLIYGCDVPRLDVLTYARHFFVVGLRYFTYLL